MCDDERMRNFSVLKERFFARIALQKIFVNSKLELVALSTLNFPETVYIIKNDHDSREIVSINYSIYSRRASYSLCIVFVNFPTFSRNRDAWITVKICRPGNPFRELLRNELLAERNARGLSLEIEGFII